jgi:hypothetical protein
MSLHQTACPSCRAQLRSSKPIPPGKSLRCPRCGSTFTPANGGPKPSAAPVEGRSEQRLPAMPGAPAPEDTPRGGLSPAHLALIGGVSLLFLAVVGLAVFLVTAHLSQPVAKGPNPPEKTQPAVAGDIRVIDLPGSAPVTDGAGAPPPTTPQALPSGTPRTPAAPTPPDTPEGVVMLSGQWATVTAPKPLSDPVKKGLAWLASKQLDDGGWSSEEGAARPDPFGLATGNKPTVTDTCLAILALLRAGSTPRGGDHSRYILKGIDYLCKQVEKSPEDSPFVTDLRGTIVQVKMGKHFDTYAAAWTLAEAANSQMPDEAGTKRIKKALARVVAKVERSQRADGGWFDPTQFTDFGHPKLFAGPGGLGRPMGPGAFRPGGGLDDFSLAPVLGQAMAVKGLTRACQAGATVEDSVLTKARTFAQNHFDAKKGEFKLHGSFGILLYASASHLGAMQDSINTRQMVLGKKKDEALLKDIQVRDKAFKAVVNKLNDRKFLLQFGSYGGEDFLGYMLLSESMAVKSDETWRKWDESMAKQLTGQQNRDGSWTGHHCTTGRTFCTAAVVLVLAADRAPVPVSVLQLRK